MDDPIRTLVLLIIGGISGELGVRLLRTFHEDYGWPWRRHVGTNGRWRVDLMVGLLFFTLGVVAVITTIDEVIGPWTGQDVLVTIFLALFAMVMGWLRWSLWTERREHTQIERGRDGTK